MSHPNVLNASDERRPVCSAAGAHQKTISFKNYLRQFLKEIVF